MRYLHLTLLFCILNFFSSNRTLEFPPSSPATINDVEPAAANIIFQSKDGGQTWQDISNGLPENEKPEGFFAGESEVYLRVKNGMYHSKNNLETPVWEKENVLDPQITSITFNRSGVMAYNHEGQIYKKMPDARNWLPVYKNFGDQLVQTVFEATDGTVFVGCVNGLYKSGDKGRSWKRVHNEGWVSDVVESQGVFIATGEKGIMRSTDKGEHWQWVISEGGVGIAIERIERGFAAISYNTTTKSRRIHISLDSGKTWKAIDEGLPPSASISSIKQVDKYLICGHPDGIFRSSDMGKTWSTVHTGVEEFGKTWMIVPLSDHRKVFTIYASGNVLYAVARAAGC